MTKVYIILDTDSCPGRILRVCSTEAAADRYMEARFEDLGESIEWQAFEIDNSKYKGEEDGEQSFYIDS